MQPPTDPEKERIATTLLCRGASQKLEQYAAFLRLYESIISPSNSNYAVVPINNPAFASHDDVLSLYGKLKADPKQTRRDLMGRFSAGTVSSKDKEEATRALVRVAFMLDCASKQSHPEGFKVGDFVPLAWQDNERFVDFVARAFPSPTAHPPSHYRVHDPQQKKRLKAWKLKKRNKIKFRPTDDINEHLLYDPEERTVKVFHHTGFLKAHLQRSLSAPIDLGFEESLQLGTLPPQLVLETLDSIHFVLFPISTDPKSARFLDKLCSKHDFDRNIKVVEGHVRELPEQFEYKYWGDRLERLLNIVTNPPPANRLVAWFERHTSERNALTVAILGLFLTVLFGFLGLLVGIAQLVFAILQWKTALNPP